MAAKKKAAPKKATRRSPVPSDALPSSFPEQTEIPGMESPPIPKLERRAREIANRRDRIKILREEEKGLVAEAIDIMHEHEIPSYVRHGVRLRIKADEKLDVSVDGADEDNG